MCFILFFTSTSAFVNGVLFSRGRSVYRCAKAASVESYWRFNILYCAVQFLKFLERRKRSVLLEIGRTSLSYVEPHASHGACLLTAWSRILLEKITSSQLVRGFPVQWNPKVHYCFYKCPPPVSNVSTSCGAL